MNGSSETKRTRNNIKKKSHPKAGTGRRYSLGAEKWCANKDDNQIKFNLSIRDGPGGDINHVSERNSGGSHSWAPPEAMHSWQ